MLIKLQREGISVNLYSMIKNTKKILLITGIFTVYLFVSIFVSANQDEMEITTEPEEVVREKFSIADEKDEKIIISIVNFGRSNPFYPYVPAKNKKEEVDLFDIPYPPKYEEQDRTYRDLLSAGVNGILYDPYSKSVAIVNIAGDDYMVHKGDTVKGILIEDIGETSVTLKYNANTFTLAVGDVIEGDINHDSVERKEKIFAETGYRLPDLELEELMKE